MKVPYLIGLCAVAGCVNSQVANEDFSSAYDSAIPFCDLLSRPKEFVGHRVTVRGLYANTPHNRVLFDRSCPSKGLTVEIVASRESLSADRKMQKLLSKYRTVGIRSVYSGLMKSRPIIGGCSEDNCFAYSLVEAKLEAAEWTLR